VHGDVFGVHDFRENGVLADLVERGQESWWIVYKALNSLPERRDTQQSINSVQAQNPCQNLGVNRLCSYLSSSYKDSLQKLSTNYFAKPVHPNERHQSCNTLLEMNSSLEMNISLKLDWGFSYLGGLIGSLVSLRSLSLVA
jgi:hypothetical protein